MILLCWLVVNLLVVAYRTVVVLMFSVIETMDL